MVKINGLFLDYDGTISPLNVSRQQSRVLPHIETLLKLIQKFTYVAIITTKDLPFIVPRTTFAHAWGAVAGLEMKVGSSLFKSQSCEKKIPSLNQALDYARQMVESRIVIEEKYDSSGKPLGFCVDWRQMRNEKEARIITNQIISCCHNLSLDVVEYHGRPYFDVFPCPIDKGRTLRELKEKLGLSQGIIYMGDSVTDNPAFLEADISIGVTTGRKPLDLACQYWISFDEVACFLSHLFKNDFNFSPDLPGIRVRE